MKMLSFITPICSLSILFSVLLPERGRAQPTAEFDYNPGRPAFTTGTGTLIQKTLSVESGLLFDLNSGGEGNALKNYYTLRFSPLKRLELFVSSGFSTGLPSSSSSINAESLSFSAKVNLLQKKNKSLPGIALLAGLSIPMQGYDTERRYPTTTIAVFVDHAFDAFGLAYNFGLEGFNSMFYSVYGDYSFANRFCVFGEFIGKTTFEESTYSNLSAQIGLAAFITKNFKMDISAGTRFLDVTEGLTDNIDSGFNNVFIELGLAYGIPLAKMKNSGS